MELSDLTRAVEKDPEYATIISRSSYCGKNFLFPVFKRLGVKTAVEVGTHFGHSAAYMAAACGDNGGKLHSVDIDQAASNKAKAFLTRVGVVKFVEFYVGDSAVVLPKLLPTIAYQAAFIDAYHSYECAAREFATVVKHIDKTAQWIIILDDASDIHPDGKEDGGVPRLVKELSCSPEYSVRIDDRCAVITQR